MSPALYGTYIVISADNSTIADNMSTNFAALSFVIVLYCTVPYCTVPGRVLAARGLPRGQREERGDRRRGAQGQGDLVLYPPLSL